MESYEFGCCGRVPPAAFQQPPLGPTGMGAHAAERDGASRNIDTEQHLSHTNGQGGSLGIEQPAPPQRSQGDGAWRKHHTVFTNAKAGMDMVDKDHVQRVVYEMSKDSAHFKNEQRKQAQTEERIKRMKQQAAQLTPAQLAAHLRATDATISQLAATRKLTSTWLVVDMDAFYASVEELHDPSLKDKPMAVGGIGMICTANYVARRYGVRSAMPGFIGRRLCPQLVFVRPDFQKYSAVSKQARAIFADFDPELEAYSLDEAFLNVTTYCAQHGLTGAEVAEKIRQRVREETHVTCSVGVGPNRMLAKICADKQKPDGQYVLPAHVEAVTRFMDELPIRKVPGIGKVSEQILKAFGVEVCKDLITHRALLSAIFSKVSIDYFLQVGLGLGQTEHSEATPEGEVGRKGISCERTFRAISQPAELEAKLEEIAEHLAGDMAREDLQGRTLTLKLKSATTFEVHTRAVTLPSHVSSAEDLYAAALKLMRAEYPITLRLMGIRVSAFKERPAPPPGQKTLSDFLRTKLPAASPASEGAGSAAAGVQHRAAAQGDTRGRAAHDAALPQTAAGMGSRQDRLHSGDDSRDSWALTAADGGGGGGPELTLRDWAPEPDSDAEDPTQEVQDIELSLRDWDAPGNAPEPSARNGKQAWACRTCTFVNPRHLLRCELCETPQRGPLSIDFQLPSDGRREAEAAMAQDRSGHVASGSTKQHQHREATETAVDQASSGRGWVAEQDSRLVSRCFGDAQQPSSCVSDHAAPGAQRQGILEQHPARQPGTAGASGPQMPGGAEAQSIVDSDAQGTWQCSRCGKSMLQTQQVEHSDWHFAADLQRQQPALDCPASALSSGSRQRLSRVRTKQQGGSSRKRKSQQSSGMTTGTDGAGGRAARGRKQKQAATIDSLLDRHRQAQT